MTTNKKVAKMQIEINLTPEQIDQYVTQAVLDSALGAKMKEVIKSELESLTTDSYNKPSPLRTAISSEIQRLLWLIIREEYADLLREAVRKKLTDEIVSDTVDVAFDAFMEKMNQAKMKYQ